MNANSNTGERRSSNPGQVVNLDRIREKIHLPRILVLEDDPDFCSIIREYLESIPFDVTAVTNGVDGVRAVMAGEFDAVLCDMMMPKMAGDLFFLAVERVKPDLCQRFVFMSGHANNPKIQFFIEKIGGTMLLKPFHMNDLRDSVEFVLLDAELRKALKPKWTRFQ